MNGGSLVPKATNYKNVKPLTAEQLKGMTRKEVKLYYKGALRANRANIRASKALARQTNYAKYGQAKMLHDTIRQGLAEASGALTTAIIGGNASSGNNSSPKAKDDGISQNILGGINEVVGGNNANTGSFVDTENGPVYSENARRED